nr:MAG TPA: hypothetical protein [Caudoviricetes sp.]
MILNVNVLAFNCIQRYGYFTARTSKMLIIKLLSANILVSI